MRAECGTVVSIFGDGAGADESSVTRESPESGDGRLLHNLNLPPRTCATICFDDMIWRYAPGETVRSRTLPGEADAGPTVARIRLCTPPRGLPPAAPTS